MELAVHHWHRCQNLPKKQVNTSLIYRWRDDPVKEGLANGQGLCVLKTCTGRPLRTCLVTLRTNRDIFTQLELSRVDPLACLEVLNASVSKSPAELAPVPPVLEFNMVDSRFIEETDVLSGLDQRPNLMDLTPSEFESLITNLFQKMGLYCWCKCRS